MDPFNEGTDLCKVPVPPVRPVYGMPTLPPIPPIPTYPLPVQLFTPKKVTRAVAVRIPMLSDETEVLCGDPAATVVDRFRIKDPDECDVWQHYKQMFNSRIPRDDEDMLGVVQRTYFAEMCDFEVRWEPRDYAGVYKDGAEGANEYYDEAQDHLGGWDHRYGQTHVRIFPGQFRKGPQRVQWPGLSGVFIPPGVWDLYIVLPVTAWLSSHTPDEALASLSSGVQPIVLRSGERDEETCALLGLDDVEFGGDADHFIGRKEGQMDSLYFKVAVVGDGVIPRANRLELPRGIRQLHASSIDLSGAATRNTDPPLVARIPMLSDEVDARFDMKEPDVAQVWQHYKQMFNSKVPEDASNPAGEVTRAYFAAMCDFEVRWDPTESAYYDGAADHLGGSEFRYGQTHVTVFSGTFVRGEKRATWPGEAGIAAPEGVRGVYLKYPLDFWPAGGSPDFDDFSVEFFDDADTPVAPQAGFELRKIAIIGPGVLERANDLELEKGILQVVTASFALFSIPPADADYKVLMWDQSGFSGTAGRWVADYPRLI